MPAVPSLDPIFRDSVDSDDLLVLYDVSVDQGEALHKLKFRDFGLAYNDIFDVKTYVGGFGINIDTDSSSVARINVDSDLILNNLTVKGTFKVDGTNTVINSTTLTVNDKNIVLADSATSGADADGGGITLAGANATILWDNPNERWVFSHDIYAPNLDSSTDDLPEGTTNLYYTQARVDSDIAAYIATAFTELVTIYDSAGIAIKSFYGLPV